MDLEPLYQLLHVLNGKECPMGVGGDHVTVRGMLGTEDTPVLEIKAKPGDHGKRGKGVKKVILKGYVG